ncbi:hypothetical protein KUL42_02130 [Alteromonas sp. KUL42]|uniref:hypothetical protein n=1 Tax=Alteromonas sp. KUL42 TaxID=2480797 RepID=UPI001036EF00|nr:hypothetical protein [Alteromonas sp. KUL42]TAP38223.1 hypothetical protein EYR97_01035 [Alteromonas sp. KUL42]GEA05452.1 hypothetical protein KUL42_02130 [Alteromonas sp. KUL42]
MQNTSSAHPSSTKTLFKHGEYTITLEGHVIKAEFTGVATENMMKQYHADVVSLVQPLQGASWGFLGSIHGTGVLTPETEALLVASLQERMKIGMRGCAVIADGAKIPAMVVQQLARVFKKASMPYLFCSSDEEGFKWLAEQGCVSS